MQRDTQETLQAILAARYQDPPQLPPSVLTLENLSRMAARGSCRSFSKAHVPPEIQDVLCATALAAPTKSDLQQRDIILLRSAEQRAGLARLVPEQPWVAEAPLIAVFCGNNRRQRLLHEWHGIPFANDHIDALFNAATDAAIALGAFVTAAEAIGLGCCPISAVRNEARAVSTLLALPEHVFPFAGLAIGYPLHPPQVSMRLPLRVTCHEDIYRETNLRTQVATYDRTRAEAQPYKAQRMMAEYGWSADYGWSEDKARQYSKPERADFGEFLREKGFQLE